MNDWSLCGCDWKRNACDSAGNMIHTTNWFERPPVLRHFDIFKHSSVDCSNAPKACFPDIGNILENPEIDQGDEFLSAEELESFNWSICVDFVDYAMEWNPRIPRFCGNPPFSSRTVWRSCINFADSVYLEAVDLGAVATFHDGNPMRRIEETRAGPEGISFTSTMASKTGISNGVHCRLWSRQFLLTH